MQKAYDHNQFEDALYDKWEASGKMRADSASSKPAFTIPLPPPNVTGQLHLGHAAMLAIEDIMIRYKKMTGHESLWIPGTDHAAIATENVVIKHLGAKSREEYDREEFLDHCRTFAADKHDTIVNQMKKMGAWLDWSREAYTFDDTRNNAVNTMFKMLYEDGLIERGYRMINWSVGAQSVLSDDEVEHKEIDSHFYHYRYFLLDSDGALTEDFVEIATTRPETLFGDSALAIHPEDPRAKDLVGRLVQIPFTNREIPIIADTHADPEFGTGMLKVTPAHDPNDFEIGQRHDLEKIQVIGFDGKMMDNGYVSPDFVGMSREQCRKAITRLEGDFGELVKKYLVKHKPHTHNVGFCYRSETVVEPMISPQWFILVNKEFTDKHTGKKTTLCRLTADGVKSGEVEIVPKRFEKNYFQWTDNLQDWCISRQIWWGHRIPVWHDKEGGVHLPKEQKIIFTRHGETGSNNNKYYNTSEELLNNTGKIQAQKMAEKLQDRNITKIVCSSAPRAQETAGIVAKELGVGIDFVLEDLLEANVGKKYRGKPYVKDEKTGENISSYEIVVSEDGGETCDELIRRTERAWEVINSIDTDGEILVIAHGSVNVMMFAVKENTPKEDLLAYSHNKWVKMNNGELREVVTLVEPKGEGLRQDEDTLDTWFSSALWPFSTLGWPNSPSLGKEGAGGSSDLSKFYQNDVLETGWDILTFWVLRMVMFGRYAMGEYPFKTVYLHGMVCDEHGKKMSKSKGNGIDPLEMISDVGADAVRLSLVIGSSPGNPIPIGKNKIKGYRNFVNKLWNAGRFVQMQIEQNLGGKVEAMNIDQDGLYTADAWILSRLSVVSGEVKKALEKYEISAAGDMIYHFVWDEFCDWYVETVKGAANKQVSTQILYYVFGEILKLVHPMCPFVTETLWGHLYDEEGLLVDQDFPKGGFKNLDAERAFALFQSVVGEVRKVRIDHKINPKDRLDISIVARDSIVIDDELALRQNVSVLQVLAQLGEVSFESNDTGSEHVTKIILDDVDVQVEVPFDEEKEKERLKKEREALEKSIAGLEGRLSNKSYTDKAPKHLVEETQAQLRAAQEKLTKLG